MIGRSCLYVSVILETNKRKTMESTEKINILVLILPISTKPYRALSIELYYSLYDFLTNSYFNTCSTLRNSGDC